MSYERGTPVLPPSVDVRRQVASLESQVMNLGIVDQWLQRCLNLPRRDWYFIAEQPAPAPHLAHPEGCAALRISPGPEQHQVLPCL